MSNYNQTSDPAVPVETGDGAEDRSQNWNYQPNEDGAIPIPVRIGSSQTTDAEILDRSLQDDPAGDAIVKEYEAKYHRQNPYAEIPVAPQLSRKRKRDWKDWDFSFTPPPRHRYQTRPAPEHLEDNERMWAAIAHGSALLTILVAMFATPGVLLTVLVPLGIYIAFRKSSEYVAFHALQAFTIQVVGTVGALILLVTGLIVLIPLIILSALLSIILIGIPFLILFGLLLIAVIMGFFILPLAMVVYSMIAADAAYKGRNYRYPYIADWLDDQLKNGALGSII